MPGGWNKYAGKRLALRQSVRLSTDRSQVMKERNRKTPGKIVSADDRTKSDMVGDLCPLFNYIIFYEYEDPDKEWKV